MWLYLRKNHTQRSGYTSPNEWDRVIDIHHRQGYLIYSRTSEWIVGVKPLTVQAEIERKIRASLSPEYLDVINESHMHNVPPGSESHFKVIVVSPFFDGLGRVQRHQHMNTLLADELAGPVHALSMETLTATEWVAKGGQRMESPVCHGGTKVDL